MEAPRIPAGTWDIDPGHTEVSFQGRHLMVSTVRGRFTDVHGTLTVEDHTERSSAEATINMGSVDSNNRTRDEHLRSPELFDVEQFPVATFTSTGVEWSGKGGIVHGVLVLHGESRPIELDMHFGGVADDPWGGRRAAFTACCQLNRDDFGITWNMPLAAGGVLVSKSIDIDISVEFVLRGDQSAAT